MTKHIATVRLLAFMIFTLQAMSCTAQEWIQTTHVASESPYGWGGRLALSGNFAFLCMDPGVGALDAYAVTAIEVSDPEAPAERDSYYPVTNLNPEDIAISGDFAYVAWGAYGLVSIDISDPYNMEDGDHIYLAGSDHEYASGIALDVGGDYAYIATAGQGLRIVNISNPDSMFEVPINVQCSGNQERLILQGDRLYITGATSGFPIELSLQIVDVSDPENPSLVGSWAGVTPGCCQDPGHDVVVNGDYAYVAGEDVGIVVFDVSGTSPVLIRYINTPGQCWVLHMAGEYLYVGCDGTDGLAIFYLGDPGIPKLVGRYSMPSHVKAFGIAVMGETIFASAGPDDFQVLCHSMTRGDVDNDGDVDIADYNYLTNYVFHGGPAPLPTRANGDVNQTGSCLTFSHTINVNDVIFLGAFLNGTTTPHCAKYSTCDAQ